MKLAASFIAAFWLAFTSHAQEFRLLSFNIRFANPKDGADRWENRRDVVAKLIRDESDLAGLQEVLPEQRAELAERCGEFSVIGISRDIGDTGEASPILFRKDRFIALASGTFWLSDTPEVPGSHTWGNTLPRICTWAKLRDTKSGLAFHFFNTHLDHESQMSRERGIALIVERICALEGGEPVLLGGDFNITEENPAFAQLAAKPDPENKGPLPLLSAFQLMKMPAEGTFHAFTGKPHTSAIDFFFLEHDRWKLSAVAVLKTTYPGTDGTARHPSDHFPIRGVIAPAN